MSEGLSGAQLGHLDLGEVLGYGGTSTVYRALDRRTRQVVACKVMHRWACDDPAVRAQFAGPVTVIEHPNLIRILELGEHRSVLFLTMPMVAGRDLATELNSSGRLELPAAFRVLTPLAAALAAIHRRGLVHLDVKPANVLIDENRVYLSDFGLATSDRHGRAVRSGRGEFVGSPAFAAPEHLRGRPVGPAADVYSLACLLFTVLAGHPPYVGDLRSVISGHLAAAVPSLAAVTGLSRRLDEVMRRALGQDVAARPAGPQEFIQQAQVALAG